MILRRLYLLFPGQRFAERAVADLQELGVDQRHIHTVAKQGVDITNLPKATLMQRHDWLARLDRWFWDLNLLVFFLALGFLLITIWSASWIGACLSVANGADFLFG